MDWGASHNGTTLADEMRYERMGRETTQQTLERLKEELADWENPSFYKGFTQEERNLYIAGKKKLIAKYEQYVLDEILARGGLWNSERKSQCGERVPVALRK